MLRRPNPQEFAHFERASTDINVLHARFVTHAYARHAHEELVIGIFESGCVRYRVRGGIERCGPGALMIFDPDEPHDGIPEEGGFVKRVAYVPMGAARSFVGEIGRFGRTSIADVDLWQRWGEWLRVAPGARETLAVETQLAALLATTYRRWSTPVPGEPTNRRALIQARARMRDEPEYDFSLHELAGIGLRAERRLVDKIIDKLSLHR